MKIKAIVLLLLFYFAGFGYAGGGTYPWYGEAIKAGTIADSDYAEPGKAFESITEISGLLDAAGYSKIFEFVTFDTEETEMFRVILPEGYPDTSLTEDNVYLIFPDRYGKFSIRDIKEALGSGKTE